MVPLRQMISLTSSFTCDAHLQVLQVSLFEQRHMLPLEVQRLCAVPHARVGHDQHIVPHQVAHIGGFACFA